MTTNNPIPVPGPRDPDYNEYAALFNDVTTAPNNNPTLLSQRDAIAEHLWGLGYRKQEHNQNPPHDRGQTLPPEEGMQL